MSEQRVVRPSMKFVAASYAIVILVLAAAAYGLYGYLDKEFSPWHLLALVLLFLPFRKHLGTRMVSLTIDSDHITEERGILSRARRTVDLSKIQDVTVKQTIVERILGLGDLHLESAGQNSATIVMEGIDSPRAVADLILARAKELMRHRSQGSTL
jgi:uncharacterized membrane protein YdbT with pleckstrin-like domain